TEQKSISSEFVQNIKPAHPFEAAERRRPECVVEMYAEPRFTVELIVPVGYRGLIKAEMRIQDDVPVPPGQRCFRYQVADGFVSIKGPRALRHVCPPEYRARYADGTPLPSEMTLLKVGFRWMRGEGQKHYFFVGTQPEYDMERRTAPAQQVQTPRRDGGRGGRHHGGD
ncbi:MAG: hypothetical protein ACRELF_12640, partial [Gemmataceae bacterium]